VLAVLAAVSATGLSQGLEIPAAASYEIVARDGAQADVAFARRWLDAAEQLMVSKYHVTPARYRISVNLLSQPENDIDTNQSGQNRCCTTGADGLKSGSIFLLGPSASIWSERRLLSSLALPKAGEDYHAKVLMSEYIPIGHYAVQDSRPSGGWTYYSAPPWFFQGLQEYDGIYHTTETNRTQTAAALLAWARQNQPRFACCAKGMELADVYNGGGAFMAFLAAEFGEGVHERILRNDAATFDEALLRETGAASQNALFERFLAWVPTSR
jgi:hypothetical protein